MIAFAIGTTAEAIKVSPIIRRLKIRGIDFQVWNFGQQPEDLAEAMIGLGFEEAIKIRAKNSRNLRRKSQVPSWLLLTSANFVRNRRALLHLLRSDGRRPLVIVHGDTMTASLATLLARASKIDVAHIEAGLRSHRWNDPFPEELSRRLVARFAILNFAPGKSAVRNLQGSRGLVVDTQFNTSVDSLRENVLASSDRSEFFPDRFGLVSLHRSELLSDHEALRRTVNELEVLSQRVPLMMVQDSLTIHHFNRLGISVEDVPGIMAIKKLPYQQFLHALGAAEFVITDSGGLQEECAFLRKPCLIHRRHTERDDGLDDTITLSLWTPGSIANFTWSVDGSAQANLSAISPSDIVIEHLRINGYI